MELDDLNLCGSGSKITQKFIQFGVNIKDECRINGRSLIEKSNVGMLFHNLYLNYYENNIRFLKVIPILIRDAFTYNEVSFFSLLIYKKIVFFIFD